MDTAYNVHTLSKLSISIESIAAHENNVVLGTRNGQLLMYTVNDKMELQLLKFEKNFSKKAVVQLALVPELQILFSLSDNLICASDISGTNFSLIHSIVQTRGASIFCIKVNTTKSSTAESKVGVLMCVAVKRKLEFYYWKNTVMLRLNINSIELQDIPKALSWVDDIICIGFKDEYVLYNINVLNDPKKHKLFEKPTNNSNNQEPCICVLKNYIFGLTKDEFLVAVNPNNFIENNKNDKNTVLGTVDDIKPLTWSKTLMDFVWDEPYVIGRTANTVEIRCLDTNGINKDTLIQTISELSKARYIVRAGKGILFAAAFSELWYVKAVDIPIQRINLLQQKRFQTAIDLTNISNELEEEKKEIVHQIQARFARELFDSKKFTDSMNVFIKMKADAYDVIKLFPSLLVQDVRKSPVHAEVLNSPPLELEDKDLENALMALAVFLTDARQREVQRLADAKTAKTSGLLSIIDTTLLKCYLQTDDSVIAPLLRLNHCHFDEAEKMLKKYKKYKELKILYHTTGMHNRALELLQAHSTMSSSNMQGPDETIKYLQELGSKHLDLIFDHSKWLLANYPQEGLKIFTGDLIEVENLPRAKVVDHLIKFHKNLVIPYLEHIIEVWNEKRSLFHDILIKQYKDKVLNLLKECKTLDSTPTIDENEKLKSLQETRERLVNLLTTSEDYSVDVILKEFPTSDLFEERAILLGKLKKHEKVLAVYLQILGDIEKAEKYCQLIYTEEINIFAKLIQTMMTPPKAPPYTDVKLHPNCLKPNIEEILKLLDKYADKIDPAMVLEYLPDDVPLIRLQNFLEIALRKQLERKRQNQILNGLLYAEHLQLEKQLMSYEKKSVVINESVVCPVCKKRFIDQSAFVRYPNGEIVHYSCQDKV